VRTSKRAAKWKTYSAYLSVGGSITKSLKVVLPLLGIPVVGGALDAILQALEKSATVAKEGAEGIEASGTASGGTLQQLKRMVGDSLKSLPRPILVMLDDVDPLAHDEIRQLFQLIKANADFPGPKHILTDEPRFMRKEEKAQDARLGSNSTHSLRAIWIVRALTS